LSKLYCEYVSAKSLVVSELYSWGITSGYGAGLRLEFTE
jgi:hypothetical protein